MGVSMKLLKKYGKFGGMYVPEILVTSLQELTEHFYQLKDDSIFCTELDELLQNYAGRPTALTEAKNLSQYIGGPRILLKREDLLHTGAHKINNALGQCLLAKKMGKNRIIAETGAGQHGVATATACARLGLNCVVYMGRVDMERQSPNVLRMKLLGAEIIPVTSGTQTLKDAVNMALQDWSESFDYSHYCLGSALGPAPYPELVAFFQRVIGVETKQQCQQLIGKNPDCVIACVGGGSNAIGIFSAFLDDPVQLIGVEAGGTGSQMGCHAARFQGGTPGILHGAYSYVLQDQHGQIAATHSIAAGLDYPAVGPQHAFLFETQRVSYVSVLDAEVFSAFQLLAQCEGIIPAIESAHALAYVVKRAAQFNTHDTIVINVSGRGDKDLSQFQQDT